ncbi:MAG: UbiX family flavin prenyltransferase [Deltaproteobacteria bacterium]|jgi:flavin prenyltransferase
MNRYVVAVTGASGMIYARELLAYFATRPDLELHALISGAGEQVLTLELGMTPADLAPGAVWHRVDDFSAALASGSFRARAMVVIPCSMGSLGAIAQGVGRNLIHRAGEVFLKERRPLILVVRETPLSLIHLRNLTQAAEAGATIFPASPGFYHQPQDLTDLARQFAGRILDHLGLEHRLTRRWGEN